MKGQISIILAGILLTGCFQGTKFPYNRRLPNGYYENWKYSPTLYLKISNDTAFADFIIIDKFPRNLISDTLFYNSAAKYWKSEQNILQQSGAYYEFFNISNQGRRKVVIRTIRTNKLLNKKTVDRTKNYAYVNREQTKYQQVATDRSRYNRIRQKFGLFDSLEIMSHEELIIAFEKFKVELYKE